VRNGSRYAIVNGDKEYELVGELWQIGQFAGQWMTLTGVLDRETIKVSSARLATGERDQRQQNQEGGDVALHSQFRATLPQSIRLTTISRHRFSGWRCIGA
jgi:hypothetical protein